MTEVPAALFTDLAPAERLERAAAALAAKISPSRSSTTPPPRVPASKT
jgi:hypothetical protein